MFRWPVVTRVTAAGTSPSRQMFVIVVLICVSVTAMGPAMVAATQSPAPAPTGFHQTAPTNESLGNNSTVQHKDPSRVSEGGDTAALQRWLASDLSGRLSQSAIEISEDEYERGQTLLDDEFESRLDQYVTVAGETDGTADDQVGDRIREAATKQRSYAEALSEYQTTYDRYQRARRTGNTTAARRYARTLGNRSTELRELNTSLTSTYSELDQSGVGTDQAAEAIANTTRAVIATQSEVQADTFVETRLTITAPDTTASFIDPLPVTGQLTTGNGTAVTNRSIQIRIFERTYTTTTDRNGSFVVQYRPVSLPVTARNTAVRYRPTATAPYLGTEATLPINVTQVTPAATAAVQRSPVRYGDRISVVVYVTVAGRPVPSLPIRMNRTDSTVSRTTAGGTAQLRRQVPATLASGQTRFTVSHDREGLAVGPVHTTASVRVATSETTLTAEAASRAADTVRITGRLRTAAGTPISAQPVTITIGNTTTTTITNATGGYQQQVALPEAGVNGSTTATLRFAGTSTNLAPTETTVQLPTSRVSSGDAVRTSAAVQWVFLGVLAVGAAVGGYLYQRRRAAQAGLTPDTAGDADQPPPEADQLTEAQELIRHARERLVATDGADPTVPAVAAYAALRAATEPYDELPDALTHREFRSACESQLKGIDTVALATVIEGYERAVFAPAVDAVDAEAVVTAAEELVQQVQSRD